MLWQNELDVPADINELAATRESIYEMLLPLGFPESSLFDIKVALGEALANAVRHGTVDGRDSRIRSIVRAYPDRTVIEVHDSGEGFDGTHVKNDDLYAPGGRGIMFMRALMDRVEFAQSDLGGTMVRLVKHRAGMH